MSISILIVVIFSSPLTRNKNRVRNSEGRVKMASIFLFIMASLVFVAGNSVYHLAVDVFMLETRTGKLRLNIYAIVT